MGGGQSQVVYSVPVNKEGEEESAIYRNATMPNKLLENPSSGATTMRDVFVQSVQKYPNSPLLGTRNPLTGQYDWKTYKKCFQIAENVGKSILRMNLTTPSEEVLDINQNKINMDMIGVFSKNREEWLLLEYADFLYNFTLVPLYDTLGEDALKLILEQTCIKTIFCSKESVQVLLKLKNLVKLEYVVSFDDLSEEVAKIVADKNLKLLYFKDLANQQEKEEESKEETRQITKNDIFTFSYTSGTTGAPKGALISHRNIVGIIANAEAEDQIDYNSNDVYISYLPLPHVLERIFVSVMIYFGARIGFYSGDVMKLKDDLQVLRPTIFVSVPRLYSRFYDTIKKTIDGLTGMKGYIAKKALQAKLDNNQKDNCVSHSLYDKLIFSRTKQALGGRVRMAATGGAPISGDVLKFLKVTLCTNIVEGYGQTESTGATFNTASRDPQVNIVGGVSRNMEFKLIDIPEMSYTSKDVNKDGKLAPRGEVCFRGVCVFSGYYKDMEKTNEAVDKDGWLHSGDVGLLNIDNGSLKIIDRKKNLFKLSQGEYIAPEKIENIYQTSKALDEVWIHGESLQAFLICVGVPNQIYLNKMAVDLGIKGTFEELCNNEAIKTAVLKDLESLGKEAKLLSFEQAKKIHLEPIPFLQHDILTTSFKIKRKEARDKFAQIIQNLYK